MRTIQLQLGLQLKVLHERQGHWQKQLSSCTWLCVQAVLVIMHAVTARVTARYATVRTFSHQPINLWQHQCRYLHWIFNKIVIYGWCSTCVKHLVLLFTLDQLIFHILEGWFTIKFELPGLSNVPHTGPNNCCLWPQMSFNIMLTWSTSWL